MASTCRMRMSGRSDVSGRSSLKDRSFSGAVSGGSSRPGARRFVECVVTYFEVECGLVGRNSHCGAVISLFKARRTYGVNDDADMG